MAKTTSNSHSFWHHPIEVIEEALHIRKQIAELEAKLAKFVWGPYDGPSAAKPTGKGRSKAAPVEHVATFPAIVPMAKTSRKKKKGGMSAEAKARISEAQKARWAAKRAAAAPTKSVAAPKPKPSTAKKKGGMSAEAKAKISEAQKARWAAKRDAATSNGK